MCVLQFFFLFAFSYHLLPMKFYFSFLLLLVVLSTYLESPQPSKSADSLILLQLLSASSYVKVGVLALVLLQNASFREDSVFVSLTNLSLPCSDLRCTYIGSSLSQPKLNNSILPFICMLCEHELKSLTARICEFLSNA
jgi:hypothetical protein